MTAETERPSPAFTGKPAAKKLATRAFEVLRARGMFAADNAPIRVPLDSLTAFLADHDGAKPDKVEEAVRENDAVFALEEEDGTLFVATTRAGEAPVHVERPNLHDFPTRLMTPEPKRARPPRPRPKPAQIDPSWASFSLDDLEALELDDEDEEEVETDLDLTFEADDVVPAEVVDEQGQVSPAEDSELTETAGEPDEVAAAGDDLLVAADDETLVTAQEVDTEPMSEAEAAPETLDQFGTLTDLSDRSDEEIAGAITATLGKDVRVAQFGGMWMSEDRVPRLSRGDLRKIREYIEEQEQPLTDETLVQDILGVRQNSPDFDATQFAVNVRLSRESRDFDFVGTQGQRFWSTQNLAHIGTTRRKPNDIGTDYRFLTETASTVEPRSATSVEHTLSFYEYNLGLLPYNEALQALLPAPVVADQRAAVLTFEIAQSYTTYLVELRYPTPNRGGFLLGLDDFYVDNLVPGAVISISATENDGHYNVEFLAGEDEHERLLELDDRRAARYTFRPTTYNCAVDSAWLLTEDRFPNLGSGKPLNDKTRRRPELVVEATFNRIGADENGGLTATFADLFAAVNVERPFSEALLRGTLESHAGITDNGSDSFTYVSGA